MTVKELIEELLQHDMQAEVIYRYVGDYNCDCEILSVRAEKADDPRLDKQVVIS